MNAVSRGGSRGNQPSRQVRGTTKKSTGTFSKLFGGTRVLKQKTQKEDEVLVRRATTLRRTDKTEAPARLNLQKDGNKKNKGSESFFSRSKERLFEILRGESKPAGVDSTLIALLVITIVFGLIMLSSAGSVKSYQDYNDPYYLLKHQLLNGVFIGVVMFYVMSHIDYHYWRRYAFPILVCTLILLFAVFIPSLGIERLGAKRWISIGGFDFQPSEILKISFLFYLAAWLEKHKKNIHDPQFGFLSFVSMLGVMVLLVAVGQKDLGTTMVIAAIAIVTYFVGGAPWKHLFSLAGVGAAAFLALVAIAPYRLARITTFLQPAASDKSGVGFHVQQALIAIGSGGIFGVGFGHSQQKFNSLPEGHTDSIFAIMGEELGFLFAVGVIILFTMMVIRSLKIAQAAPDDFGRYVAVGVATWIGFQAMVNIGAMLSVLPLTGIPLPFISYGSSALIMQMAAMGVLVNISRQMQGKAVKK